MMMISCLVIICRCWWKVFCQCHHVPFHPASVSGTPGLRLSLHTRAFVVLHLIAWVWFSIWKFTFWQFSGITTLYIPSIFTFSSLKSYQLNIVLFILGSKSYTISSEFACLYFPALHSLWWIPHAHWVYNFSDYLYLRWLLGSFENMNFL